MLALASRARSPAAVHGGRIWRQRKAKATGRTMRTRSQTLDDVPANDLVDEPPLDPPRSSKKRRHEQGDDELRVETAETQQHLEGRSGYSRHLLSRRDFSLETSGKQQRPAIFGKATRLSIHPYVVCVSAPTSMHEPHRETKSKTR